MQVQFFPANANCFLCCNSHSNLALEGRFGSMLLDFKKKSVTPIKQTRIPKTEVDAALMAVHHGDSVKCDIRTTLVIFLRIEQLLWSGSNPEKSKKSKFRLLMFSRVGNLINDTVGAIFPRNRTC